MMFGKVWLRSVSCLRDIHVRGIKSLFQAPTGSATEPTGNLLMKLAMKDTCFTKRSKVIVYSSLRNTEHVRHITFV